MGQQSSIEQLERANEALQEELNILKQKQNDICISRPGVGAVVFNGKRELLVGIKNDKYQLVQGSVDTDDNGDFFKAVYRELGEEVGLLKHQVMLVRPAYEMIGYRMPNGGRYANAEHRTFMWFLFCIKDSDTPISPEYREFNGGAKWVSVEEFLAKCEPRKKPMYLRLLSMFGHEVIGPLDVEKLLGVS